MDVRHARGDQVDHGAALGIDLLPASAGARDSGVAHAAGSTERIPAVIELVHVARTRPDRILAAHLGELSLAHEVLAGCPVPADRVGLDGVEPSLGARHEEQVVDLAHAPWAPLATSSDAKGKSRWSPEHDGRSQVGRPASARLRLRDSGSGRVGRLGAPRTPSRDPSSRAARVSVRAV